MKLFLGLVSIIVLVSTLLHPSPAFSQADRFGEGVKADQATASKATLLVETFVNGMNEHDAAVVDLVSPASYPEFFGTYYHFEAVEQVERTDVSIANREIILYETSDVLVHNSGHISIQLVYSGWVTDATFFTDRWYLLPTDDDLLIDGHIGEPLKIPDGMARADIDVSFSLDQMMVSELEIDSSQILVLNAENIGSLPIVATLLSPIDSSMGIDEAQMWMSTGSFEPFVYLGPITVTDGEIHQVAFLIEPGKKYFLQAFQGTLDSEINYLPGEQFIAEITVGVD